MLDIPARTGKKIKVVVVDDSPFIRHLLTEILGRDPDIEVVAQATDPIDAREKIKATNPDVITLDIEMPRMNGLDFLEKIMRLRPTPVIMVSTLTTAGAEATVRALELGAVDVVAKPSTPAAVAHAAKDLAGKIKIAAAARLKAGSLGRAALAAPHAACRPDVLVTIGSSTGGVEALGVVVPALPADCSPVVITQHMPEHFTASFAARLDKSSAVHVVEATDGLALEPGLVAIAPGGRHLMVEGTPGRWRCVVRDGDLVSGHKPSVDVLFRSAVPYGPNVVAVMLTGMGRDGAQGMKRLRDAGARTIGQDEQTSVVYGMPRAAWEIGAIERQMPLPAIGATVAALCAVSKKGGIA